MERSLHAALLVVLGCLLWATPSLGSAAPARDAESVWIANAGRLVAVAVKGEAPIGDFRGQVDRSRESLRHIFLANRGKAPDPRRALHMQMLVLSMLLEAAAGCHQGGKVACPPALISQLISQRNIVRQLAATAGAPSAGAGS